MSPDQPHLHLLDQVPFDPIFIMGDARSGTTVLYDLLARTGCFNVVTVYHVVCYDELLHNHLKQRTDEAKAELSLKMERLGIVDRKADRFLVGPEAPEEYGWLIDARPKQIKRKTLSKFVELCRKVQFLSDPSKPLLVKNPDDYNNFRRISRMFPNARMIFNHRNPVAILNSWIHATRSIFGEKNPLGMLLSSRYEWLWRRPLRLHIARLLLSDTWRLGFRIGSRRVVSRANYYLDHIGEMDEAKYTATSYEALCSEPDQAIEAILGFLGLTAENSIHFRGLVQPRTLRLLPTVEENLHRLDRKLERYCRSLGFPLPSAMAGPT
jgi:hypothetical protein